ncbi:hypothetical protein NESM_000074500 [Novymonas esmeraldas]|uniref:Uncharacterized protein n=1 Tax=Novymonas esmeraldas TaxID=1808958 RepID=A0AAW0F0Y8_9TRYP
MAEAARTTRHYVSDCLAERYPYDANNGFAGIRRREAGRVFNGYGVSGVDDLMNSITDPSVSVAERAKAVHHLYSRSAAQETKLQMLDKGIVPLLVSTLRGGGADLLLAHQCLLLLRSLATLPQGCFALIKEGAIAAATAALRTDAPAAGSGDSAQTCRVAAAHVLYQVSSNMSGLRWLLGVEHDAAFEGPAAACGGDGVTPEALMLEVSESVACAATPAKATAYLVQTLARLTSLQRGVEAFLAAPGALDGVVTLLRRIPLPPTPDTADLSAATLEVVWNTSLDSRGGAAVEQRGVPDSLFQLLAAVNVSAAVVPVCVQRQLTGALSAVLQLTSVKLSSTGPVSSTEERLRIVAVMDYIRAWNKVATSPPSSDAAAVMTNAVQCVRLASEVKAIRDITHATLDAVDAEDATEGFHLRRQLYFHTRWEAEYHASVKV